MDKFQTRIIKRRFVVTPFTALVMQGIAESVRVSISNRIGRGIDVNDAPAKPLAKRYARKKNIVLRRGRVKAVRDWMFTGSLMASMNVLTAAPNRATIGFTSQEMIDRAYINNRRWRQFGMAPSDKRIFLSEILKVKFVTVRSAEGVA